MTWRPRRVSHVPMYCGPKTVNGLECACDTDRNSIEGLVSYRAECAAIIRRLGTYNARRNAIEDGSSGVSALL